MMFALLSWTEGVLPDESLLEIEGVIEAADEKEAIRIAKAAGHNMDIYFVREVSVIRPRGALA